MFLRYRYLRGFFNEVIGSQSSTVLILSENLVCTHIFPSKEADKFETVARDNKIDFICAEEYKSSLLASIERTRAQGYSPDTVVRLSGALGGNWYKVSFALSKTGDVTQFISYWTPANDLMSLQKAEHESRQKIEAYQGTSFDIVWCIDVEKRQVTLFNDVTESRHGVISRAAGVYDLREIVLLQDYLFFEERLNLRIKDFVKFGVDFGSDHILNLRLHAPRNTTVWHSLKGILVRGDDGRLLMYGTTHRLDKLQFPDASATDFSNLFSRLQNSSVLRIFWCNMDTQIQGGNATFARDMHVNSLSELTRFNLSEKFEGTERHGIELMYSMFTKMKNENYSGPMSNNISFPAELEEGFIKGGVELIPITDADSQLTGALFVYWIENEGRLI